MSFAKSALKRSLKIASLAGNVLKEEVKRVATGQDLDLSRLKQAKMIVEELGRLKGTAMKFGQMLALEGRDFFPPEVVAILERLQNQANFLPISEITSILSRELGDRVSLIESLSQEPIAAASIGQVHRAKFHGRDIVLKIQYPGVAQSIDSDMKILRTVVDRLTPLFHGKKIDYSGLFQELTEVFKHETNYLREAKFTTQFRAFIKDVPHLRVPEVIPELSTERVLALGFEAGESLTTALKKPEFSEQVRLHYAKLFLDLYAREFLDWGVVQTDPNLGNFLIDLTTKDLVLLDFGAVREYPLEFRRQYRLVILAAARADRADCMVQLEKIGLLDPRESEATRDALFELISESMRPFHTESFDFKNDPYAENMRKLGIAFVRQVKFTPPPRDLIFLHRKLGGIFQVVKRLEVTMDLRPILKCFQDWQG